MSEEVSQHRPPYRPLTIVWGTMIIALGVLFVATGFGTRYSVFTLLIILLGGFGLATLLLAVLPRPQAPVAVTQVEILEDSPTGP